MMLCPECGEAIGPGPLDARRACHGRDGSGVARAIGRWLRAGLGRLAAARSAVRRGA